ncbi:MAG: hypothetical protein GY797_33410 [Deltaproteobacteria bacterium]|nr:hypothetical protein [Deltaproteobacteria bacterium]
MGALSNAWPTLLDIAKASNPDGSIAAVAEILNEQTPMLDDIPWIEANDGGSHKSTLRASIPTPTWRLFNQGVVTTKSTTKQISDVCGMLEAYAEVDAALVDINSNREAYRAQENAAHIEGMSQELISTLIYGDTDVDPEKFIGLAPRYYTLSGATTSGNLLTAGGSGSDNTSMWLIGWGPNTVHGIYPKGTEAGLGYEDKGQVTAIDSSNNGKYEVYRSHYKWKPGLVVRDWRSVVRIPNIDVSDLLTSGDATDNSANLIKLMVQALHKLPSTGMMRPVFYCNETVASMLDNKLMNTSNLALQLKDLTGAGGIQRPDVLTFRGYPVRRISDDVLLSTEATIS